MPPIETGRPPAGAPVVQQPILQLAGVSRSYGEVRVLDRVSLAVHAGRCVGFVGRNGAGKTTSMRVALGLVEPDEGDVLWRGRPITRDDRLRIGYLPEERGLYPGMTALDQLVHLGRLSGLDRATATQVANDWLERLGLAGRARDKVEELSLGNQQRVQLAAALVHGPEVLVLDEPFSGLDPIGVDVMSEVVRSQAAAGAGVLFSSHQLELVERLCDDVVVIDGGRIVYAGTTREAGSLADRFRELVAR